MALIYNPSYLRSIRSYSQFKAHWKRSRSSFFLEHPSKIDYSELDLQKEICHQLRSIYKEYFIGFYGKKIIGSTGKTHIPDLIMIRKDYKEWYIIEVELFHHGDQEIASQLNAFKTADHAATSVIVAEYTKTNVFDRNFDVQKFKLCVETYPPIIWLITDHYNNKWTSAIFSECLISTFQPYCDSSGNTIYRFGRNYPPVDSKYCLCYLHKSLNAITIENGSLYESLKWVNDQKIIIYFDGIPEQWQYIEDKQPLLLFLGSDFRLTHLSNRYKLTIGPFQKIQLSKI